LGELWSTNTRDYIILSQSDLGRLADTLGFAQISS